MTHRCCSSRRYGRAAAATRDAFISSLLGTGNLGALTPSLGSVGGLLCVQQLPSITLQQLSELSASELAALFAVYPGLARRLQQSDARLEEPRSTRSSGGFSTPREGSSNTCPRTWSLPVATTAGSGERCRSAVASWTDERRLHARTPVLPRDSAGDGWSGCHCDGAGYRT